MRSSAIIAGAFAPAVLAAIQAKNVIYIVPDGYGQASQTMARDLATLVDHAGDVTRELAADDMVRGLVRTWATNNLITDSAASGTAFACGFKSYNNAVGITPDFQPVGSILEAAKLAGMKTGLVVTSTINHATPAVYASHVKHRNSYDEIASQEIGYSHPLGPMVDILLGGGRCYFKPKSESGSCRKDDKDLFGFAKSHGFHVMQNRSAFNALEKGLGKIRLPYIGLFNDDQMKYELDRVLDGDEPSLLEMVETSLNSLHRATHCKKKGYFIMIEASRIDHAGHANDPASHAHETIMYNKVMDYVRKWIDAHPDTIMMSAADHECGGLTLNGYRPLALKDVTRSREHLETVWKNRPSGADSRQFLVSEILPPFGLASATDAEVNTLLQASNLGSELVSLLSKKAGVNWSTGGHTASDINLHGYAAGEMGKELSLVLSGHHDNTELPRIVEKALGVDMDAVTKLLRANGTNWIVKRDFDETHIVDEHNH